MSAQFIHALRSNQAAFDIELDDAAVNRLAAYYDLLKGHNGLLHLVAPMSAEDFAIKHILESLMCLKYLRTGVRFADVGSGGGLPALPCLLARPDLKGILIESKEKKAKFLSLAVTTLDLDDCVRVENKQFQEVHLTSCETVMCRALDKFTDRLQRLVAWGGKRQFLLFGGPNLGLALDELKVQPTRTLMPQSEQRYLFVVDKR